MSGLTTHLEVSEPAVTVLGSARTVLDRVQAPPLAPSETAFFRGLAISMMLVVPFWAGAIWLLVRLFQPG